jgi:hypothetical protein
VEPGWIYSEHRLSYDAIVSKYLTLLLILTLMLPPLQAQSCAMGQDQTDEQQGHQHVMSFDLPMAVHDMSGHEGHNAAEPRQPDSRQHHQSHDRSGGPSGNMPDCCKKDPAEQNQDCSDIMDCGSCSAFASAISGTTRVSSLTAFVYHPNLRSGLIVPSHSYPPFRPPIS